MKNNILKITISILLIGVICVISIPMIKKVMDKYYNDSLYISASNFVDEINEEDIKDGTYYIEELLNKYNVTLKGMSPTNGVLTIKNNVVNSAYLIIGEYMALYKDDEYIIEKPNAIKTGTSIYFDPITNDVCNENDSNCKKWYLFNDDINNVAVKAILEKNTTDNVKWEDALNRLKKDTYLYNTLEEPQLISADDIALITNNKNFNSLNPDTYYFLDSNDKSQKVGISLYAWLYNYTNNCIGCNYKYENTFGYWTNTIVNDSVWVINRFGSIYPNNKDSNNFGIRPVILIPKNMIN